MIEFKYSVVAAIFIGCVAVSSVGCSDGVASTAPVQVSQADIAKSSIFRAKSCLDMIEKLPADQRQPAADMPKNAEALFNAAQADPATDQRIKALGLTVKAPTPPRTRR